MHETIFPRVVQAVAGADRTVYAYMNDGTIHLVDMKPLIKKGGVFDRLKDDSFFADRLTVMNETVAWDVTGTHDPTKCLDIDPFVISECPVVADPLETAL